MNFRSLPFVSTKRTTPENSCQCKLPSSFPILLKTVSLKTGRSYDIAEKLFTLPESVYHFIITSFIFVTECPLFRDYKKCECRFSFHLYPTVLIGWGFLPLIYFFLNINNPNLFWFLLGVFLYHAFHLPPLKLLFLLQCNTPVKLRWSALQIIYTQELCFPCYFSKHLLNIQMSYLI